MLSFEKIMENSEVGYAHQKMIYDETGKAVDYIFLAVNPSFERLAGLKRETILNRRMSEIVPHTDELDFDWINFYGKIVAEGGRGMFKQHSISRDKWFRVECFSTEKDCLTALFTDITHERELAQSSKALLAEEPNTNRYEQLTEQKKLQEQLKENQKRLEMAMDAGEHGYWEHLIETDEMYFSPGYFKMLGYGPEELPMTMATWLELLHPEDRKSTLDQINTHVLENRPFKKEVRLRCKDGHYKWISTSGKNYFYDKNGKARRVVGTHVDIDALKRQTEALKESHRMARMGHWMYYYQQDTLKGSEEIFDILELMPEQFENTYSGFMKWVHPEDREKVNHAWEESVEKHHPYDMEYRLILGDGSVKWVKAHGYWEYDENNQPQCSVGILQDISELIRERKKAERANRAKSAFLANMSHELRTPLNGIIGFSDILRSTLLDETQKEFADIIFSSAKHLTEIITDILDFSKIEAGKLELSPEKTDLRKLIEDVCSIVCYKAQSKGVMLNHSIRQDIPQSVTVDGPKLRQILVNLLMNAVKFTDDGSVLLSVSLRERRGEKSRLLFEVIDTGIGIKKTEQAKIFTPFHQADMSASKKAEGTGLGLAITKSLLDKMGSVLQLKSVYGEGSIFYFELSLDKYTR